jgi:hypothetical protein
VSVELRRLRGGSALLAAGGVALFVVVFFVDWFGSSVSGLPQGSQLKGANVSATGWETFTSSRWIWLAAMLAALAAALASAAGRRSDGPLRAGAVAAGLGALSCGLIVYRIARHSSATFSQGSLHAGYGIKVGIWFGLLAALAITVGGYFQAQAEVRPPEEPVLSTGQRFSGLALSQSDPPGGARRSKDAP